MRIIRKNMWILSIVLLFPSVIISQDSNQGNSLLWHGFETSNSWTTTDWNNNAFSNPMITGDFVSEGKKSLEIKMDAKQPGQQAVIQLLDTGDMSQVKKISVDIYNSSSVNMKIYLMLKTGQNWVYHESKRLDVKPGWNKSIAFDLSAGEFGSDGKYNMQIKEPNAVRRLGFIFEPEAKAQGAVFMDNVRLEGTGLDKLLPADTGAETDTGSEVLLDSFEGGRLRWSAAGTWSCATGVENTTITASAGKGAMKANYNLKEPGMNAVFMIEDSLDLSDASEIKMDVYYPDEFPSNMTLALSTGDKWLWQEYTTTKLKKGWNKDVTFSFKDKKWKNEGSKWSSSVNPDAINNVRRICLTLFPANMGAGYVIFDNVRIKTKNPGKIAGLTPFDMTSLAFYTWNSFEKGVNWQTQSDQSGAVAVNPVFDFGGEDNKGMQVVFSTQSSVDKATYMYRGRTDFSTSAGIKFSIYNPMPYSVKISLAFQVGDAETWIETKQMGIGPGWNKDIFFDFISPSFKSAESNWNYSEYFTRRDDIRTMFIQVYPDQKTDGSIYISDLMLARRNLLGEPGKMIGITLANNSKVSFEAISYSQGIFGAAEGSFEDTAVPAAWKSILDNGWGVSELSISDKYPAKGKKSLKIAYKDIGNKFGINYKPGGPIDFSGHTSIAFDIYNPGKALKFTLAFKSNDTNTPWYETTKQKVLNPGWNKNVTIKFDEPAWKKIVNGVTTANDAPIDSKANMSDMIFSFFGGFEGALYIDNVRWGSKSDAGMRITDGAVEQDINVEITPLEAVEAKVTLRAAYYHEQNTELNVKSAHLILRGFGNELGFYAGESFNIFDDTFRLVDSGAIGLNLLGVSLGGTIYPINTTYLFSALSLDNSEPWKLGTSYIGTARLKIYFLEKDYIGALYMNYRRGYDDNANILTGELEQSTHTFGLDSAFQLPILDIVTLNVKGEVLMSVYETLDPLFMIKGPPFLYTTQAIPSSDGKMFKYVEASARAGYLTAYGYYRQIDNNFAANFSNPDAKAGFTNADAKLTYIVDDLLPFSFLKSISPEFAAFVRNTQLMAECDIGKSSTFDIRNDESLALYNYHIWYRHNEEGNAVKTISNKVSGFTKILLFDLLTFRILLRADGTQGTVVDAGVYSVKPILQLTGFIEGSLKLGRDVTLTGSYKRQANEYNAHNNFYAKAEANFLGSMAVGLSYGEPPLTGYWLDDNCNDTKDIIMATFKGRF
jgi:hypothetical protein